MQSDRWAMRVFMVVLMRIRMSFVEVLSCHSAGSAIPKPMLKLHSVRILWLLIFR
jgi:hypothetical protein